MVTKEELKRKKKEFLEEMAEIRPFIKKKYVVPPPTADKWDTENKKLKEASKSSDYVSA